MGGDQHGGQAKGSLGSPSFGMSHIVIGLGLHLKTIAAQLPQHNDLHEPHHTLVDLDVFDHLIASSVYVQYIFTKIFVKRHYLKQ